MNALFVLTLILGCGPSQSASTLHWLDGHWGTTAGDLRTEERWAVTPDGDLLGTGRVQREGRLVFAETLAITQGAGDQLVYTAWPTGQDPVAFPMESSAPYSVTFANLTHDFPQRITYSRLDRTTLKVELTGVESGAPRTEHWTLNLVESAQ